MATKKKTTGSAKKRYVCVADFGCGFKVGKNDVWMDSGDTMELTVKQAEYPLAQHLIQEA